MNKLSHVNELGQANMVDVTNKEETFRSAKAEGTVHLPNEILSQFINGEWNSPKGAVLQTARLAGIQAVKQTSTLIPLCHPLAISFAEVNLEIRGNEVKITCEVKCSGKTGVEMEALTGVSVAALTVYDMVKAISFQSTISEIKLVEKFGGKSDFSHV
ncbi:MAG: cyclic pyranopterin monophosphate synthase MoaC [Bacteroidota bacterium]